MSKPTTSICSTRLESLKSLGEPFIKELFGSLEAQLTTILSELRQSLDSGSNLEIRSKSHNIKSMALNIGANRLGKIASELEEKGRINSLDEAPKIFQELESELKDVISEVKNILISVT